MSDPFTTLIIPGILSIVSLVVGKRFDSYLKSIAEAKAEANRQELVYKQNLDTRHNKLFEAFITEQQKAAVAFEGIHKSVEHIGNELAEMRQDAKTFRSEIFSRINHLEDLTARHEGILTHINKPIDRG